MAGDGKGGYLLDRNPVRGFPLPKGAVNRPVVEEQRYRAILEISSSVDWRFRLALILAHETGHRISAVRLLRWSDVLRGGLVRWRAESDKARREHVTPLTGAALRALEESRRYNPAIGDAWIFPSPKDPGAPCSRFVLRSWWDRAETVAGLEHIRGLGWHGLRRKFGEELKGIPLKDLCELGGWSGPQMVLKCYQRADEDTMREGLAARRVANRE